MSAILINFAVDFLTSKVKRMKLNKLFLLAGLLIGAFCLTACGDDDDEKSPKSSLFNIEVVGTYSGSTHLKTNFINKVYTNDTFTLTLAEDGTLTATFTDATWGVATITGISAKKVSESEGYILEGGEGSFVMNNPRDPENPTQEFSCKLENGAISADKKQLMVVISAYMAVGHGDMIFTFHTGEVLTE